MSRLVLIDTVDQLPGLLPLHAWTALSTTDLILIGDAAHPLAAHFDNADLRCEVVPKPTNPEALTRRDLLSGVDPLQRARVTWIVDHAQSTGAVAYVYGAGDNEAFTRALGMEAARSQIEVEIVYFGIAPKGVELLELVRIEERLRGPDGCPWDREQDHRSLAVHAVEEVYELCEAIASGTADDVREELGDVLLQVVFHAQIAQDEGTFDIDAVARGIVDKLVRRHPHVFSDGQADDADSVMRNWDRLKAAEKPEREGPFDGVTAGQPALPLAAALQRRAAKLGFDWPDAAGALDQVRAEVDEVASASGAHVSHEIGDLLAAVIGLARHHDVDPEIALRASTARFRERFELALASADRPPEELTSEQWLALWEAARSDTGHAPA
jgi:XTP/dITP diphosphohydrolase